MRQKNEEKIKAIKNVFSKNKKQGVNVLSNSDSSSDELEVDKTKSKTLRKKVQDEFQDSELSDDNQYGMTELLGDKDTTRGDGNINTEDGEDQEDTEAKRREEYNRKLMDFRRDELVLNEDRDGDEECSDSDDQPPKDKNIQGVEDAYDLVEKIEDKMLLIGNVVRGMDKRMSYNLRLMGSLIMPEIAGQNQQIEEDAQANNDADKEERAEAQQIQQDIQNMLKDTSLEQRKQIVTEKIKKMSEFAIKKLEMKGRDLEHIDNLKQRMQSIDQIELKKKLLQKGLGNFVLEQYLEKHKIAVDGKNITDIVNYGK